MELYELVFLAKQANKAHEENGLLGFNFAFMERPTQVHMKDDAFLKHFIDYKIRLWDEDAKQYERYTLEDDICFFCIVEEDELTEQDKEELKWCGA